jgi:small subunit ribosomal protein S20
VAVAHIKSQIKRNRQNERRRLRNKSVRSELKTRIKKARAAFEAQAPQAEELLRVALRRLDKAASKGIIHPNQAARRKSRLMRRINAIVSAGQAA